MRNSGLSSIAAVTSLTSALKGKSRARRAAYHKTSQSVPVGAPRNDLAPQLILVERSIDELTLPRRAVRKIETAHVKEVAASISQLGFCAPIVIDQDDQVIDGAIRLEAARSLGLARIPCLRTEHLSPSERRVLRLAINRLGERGVWDIDELRLEIKELIIEDAPIVIAGFEPLELDQLLLDIEPALAEKGPLEPPPDATAISRLGDMFRLGDHLLLCGDATDPAMVARLMAEDDRLVRLILTDPPYNVPIVGNVTKGKHREFLQASGEMTPKAYARFCLSFIEGALACLVDGGVLATFIDWRGYPTIRDAAMKAKLTAFNLVVWAKTNAGMGSMYRSQHELIPMFKKGTAAHVNNVALGAKGRWRSNVWSYPGASSLGSDARRGLRDHPTVKPVAMLADAILDLTAPGDIVLDPFLGSGSTLMAAQETSRACRGIELDPLYVDVIIRRFEKSTGAAAICTETGETFAVLAEKRQLEAQAGASKTEPARRSKKTT